MTPGIRSAIRIVLIALALALFVTWGVLLFPARIGVTATPTLLWWRTGVLIAAWAALFAFKALGVPVTRDHFEDFDDTDDVDDVDDLDDVGDTGEGGRGGRMGRGR